MECTGELFRSSLELVSCARRKLDMILGCHYSEVFLYTGELCNAEPAALCEANSFHRTIRDPDNQGVFRASSEREGSYVGVMKTNV